MTIGTDISAAQYVTIQNKAQSLVGTGSETRGYGQTVQSSDVFTGNAITKAQWDLIKLDIINIKIRYCDASEHDYSGYTHIVMAALARPKQVILRQICDTMHVDAVVVCRSVEGLREFIYEPANDDLLEHFTQQSKVYGDDKTIVHSLILKKYSNHSHYLA